MPLPPPDPEAPSAPSASTSPFAPLAFPVYRLMWCAWLATNLSMWLKVLFLLIAGINAMLFETSYRDRLLALPPRS